MTDADAPYHAHVYYSPDERPTAAELREDLARDAAIFFTGAMVDRPIGPHPIPQFEVHFAARSCEVVSAAIAETGLTALIHPLTDDDLADHTSLAQWIGEPLELNLSVLDPPGANKGVARFGQSDF
jgi:DOPA 4,5-dioxygenase